MSAFALRHSLLLLVIVLGLLAAFAFTITPVSAQEAVDDGDPAFVPEGELPIGAIAPTKDADELPLTERPDEWPDDYMNFVRGEPLPDSAVDKRDESVRAPAPQGLTVTSFDDDSVNLSWNASSGANVYVVEFKEGDGEWKVNQSVFGGDTTATVDGLDCDTSYSFRVRAAAFPDPVGGPSNTETQTTSLCTVAAPSNFTRTSNTCNSASFSWTAPTGAHLYRIDRYYNDDWHVSGYALAPATTDTVAIPEGGTWDFRISASGNGIDYSRAYGDA